MKKISKIRFLDLCTRPRLRHAPISLYGVNLWHWLTRTYQTQTVVYIAVVRFEWAAGNDVRND